MISPKNIHATCISYHNKGILVIGPSGSGKSDLALRMIMDKGARLVADDRTDISIDKDTIFASSPQNIAGLLEIRGIGICNFKFSKRVKISLVVELVGNLKDIERLPNPESYEIFGIKLPKIKLYPFESSSINKVILALK